MKRRKAKISRLPAQSWGHAFFLFLLMLRLATSWRQLLIRCSSKNKYNVFTYNLTLFMENVLILSSPIWTCWLLWPDCSTMTQKLPSQAMLITWNQNAILKCSCEHLLLNLVTQTKKVRLTSPTWTILLPVCQKTGLARIKFWHSHHKFHFFYFFLSLFQVKLRVQHSETYLPMLLCCICWFFWIC